MIRIIAGKHKNRRIPINKNIDYRPSTGRLREAIFSILTSGDFAANPVLNGANILDLFAGTGSLAFEALSRGAKSATLVDINSECLKHAKLFAALIGEGDSTKFLCLNALNLPKINSGAYDIIFIDPPYHKNYANVTVKKLLTGNWLKAGSIMVIELAKTDDLDVLEGTELIMQRIYGNSRLLLLKYN